MPDEPQDETSEIVAARLRVTKKTLSEAKRIFNEETTAQHRAKWSNVYRLESATEHAQKILALADPRITQVSAAEEVEGSATQARDAIRAAVDSGGGDLIGSADRLLSATAQIETEPRVPEEAKAVERLDEIERELEGRKEALDAASLDLERAQEGFETRESTLTKFLDDLTNVAAEVEFQKQAERYERESQRLWTAGLVTLVGAACVALLPLILNYVSHRHHALDGQNNVSAHLGVALAFAAVSGVLLARARNRDRNRQRNRDLSVALITMFATASKSQMSKRRSASSTIWAALSSKPSCAKNRLARIAPTYLATSPLVLSQLTSHRSPSRCQRQTSSQVSPRRGVCDDSDDGAACAHQGQRRSRG